MIPDASDLLSRLLDGGHSTIAGRLVAAFRNIGRGDLAEKSSNIAEWCPSGVVPSGFVGTPQQVIGVLDIEHTRRGYFTDDHVRTLSTLAAQVAIAIENARLYERVEKQERRLEKDHGV